MVGTTTCDDFFRATRTFPDANPKTTIFASRNWPPLSLLLRATMPKEEPSISFEGLDLFHPCHQRRRNDRGGGQAGAVTKYPPNLKRGRVILVLWRQSKYIILSCPV